MNSKKDIQKEIEGYVKGNYSKIVATELLKRDGFSDSEIDEHIDKLDIVENINMMNYQFVLGFLFNILLSLFLLISYTGTSSEENSWNTISLIGFIASLPLIYFYYKGNKLSIFITGLVILSVIFYLITSLFISFSTIFSTLISILFLFMILISVKNYYKSK